jgi:hypothetical protein
MSPNALVCAGLVRGRALQLQPRSLTGDGDLGRAFAQCDRQLVCTDEDLCVRIDRYVWTNPNQLEFEHDGFNVAAIKQFKQINGAENHWRDANKTIVSTQGRIGSSYPYVGDLTNRTSHRSTDRSAPGLL